MSDQEKISALAVDDSNEEITGGVETVENLTEEVEEITYEELQAFEAEICKDLPKINIAAAVMPAIWGPANGSIITVLFYPMWIFVDDLIYSAVTQHTVMSIIFALIATTGIIAVSVFYGMNAQRKAYVRYLAKGKTKEQWDASQKKWAIAMVIVAVIGVILATIFNLTIRPTFG